MEGYPFKVLDEDRVMYLHTEEERQEYEIAVDEEGCFRHVLSNRRVDTAKKNW